MYPLNGQTTGGWQRHYAAHGGQPGAPPPPSPGYGGLYTNPALAHMGPQSLGHPGMPHHHQPAMTHYSPQNGHALPQQLGQGPPTPGSVRTAEAIPEHWAQQLLKCEVVRNARGEHARARQSAQHTATTRQVGKAIPITNPNAVKPLPVAEANGTSTKDSVSSKDGDSTASPSDIASTAGLTSPDTPGTANHPSSTVAPIAQAPRPTAAKPPENTWSTLDMGGVRFRVIPANSPIFTYSFLTTLYLNHNDLTAIPPAISKLQHLELLDLSGNELTTVPLELGMLTSLRELFLFDNRIQELPFQLGTLHQLQTLGVEGNPLDPTQLAIIQKDGTRPLIAWLRDRCPVPDPPPEREWLDVVPEARRQQWESDGAPEYFTVLCYNILGEHYATERLYGYTPQWALAWDYRKELILTELANYKADFLCLQEVQIAHYEECFVPALQDEYDSVFYPKARFKGNDEALRALDGSATFYKKSKYKLIQHERLVFKDIAMRRSDFKKAQALFDRLVNKDHIATVATLENKQTHTRFIVANVHIEWDPNFRDVKLVQCALLANELERIADEFARLPPPPPQALPPGVSPPVYKSGAEIPIIIASDLNSVPESGVYEFMANGGVGPEHSDWLGHAYGTYTSDGAAHYLKLKSAYDAYGEIPVTNFTPSFRGGIDYIWYSEKTIDVCAVMGPVDEEYLSRVVGFPNHHFPSDHICILGEFRVKPQKGKTGRPVEHSKS